MFSLEGPKSSSDSLVIVAMTNGVQMGPGQTALTVSAFIFISGGEGKIELVYSLDSDTLLLDNLI